MLNRDLIKNVKKQDKEKDVNVFGWLKNKKDFGKIIILRIVDSSGEIRAVAKTKILKENSFLDIKKLKKESCINVMGNYDSKKKEIQIKEIKIIAAATKSISPSARDDFDIYNQKYTSLVCDNRHIYLRNEKIATILKIRSMFMEEMRDYFQKNNFINFSAPILTNITLYGDKTAFDIDFCGKKLYLTQCTAFYLESAIPAFEKVYFMSPSFRNEKSKSRRHLSEYWHCKGEIAFCDLEGMMKFVENMTYTVYKNLVKNAGEEMRKITKIDFNKFKPPYKSITYEKAVEVLQNNGFKIKFGQSIGSDEERFLGERMKKMFWIKFLPRKVEAFPYRINPSDERTTLTADLLCNESGEILGTAEKIYQKEELERRMREDFVAHPKEIYKWYIELREMGLPPHSGFGMGVERVLRSFLNLKHVRDVIPYPRLYTRLPYP